MKHYSDAQLVLELKNDDHEAFQEIYERHAGKLISIALQKTGDSDQAMDIVQELFLSLWKTRGTIQLNGSLAAYLTVSVNYMAFKWYKKQKLKPVSIEFITEDQEYYEDITTQKLITAELSRLINVEINNMPEKMRQVYLYSREQDMTGPQIAEQLGVSHQTVRNQISTALTRLKRTVQEYYMIAPFDNFSGFLLLVIFFPLL